MNQDLNASQSSIKSPSVCSNQEPLIDLFDKVEEQKEEVFYCSKINYYNSIYHKKSILYTIKFCVALFEFKASHSNMIDLLPEQIYKVVQKQDEKGNKDWWLLEYEGFFKGYAPRAYLKLLD